MCASHYRNSSTILAREKIHTVTERREAELYGKIWCIMVAQTVRKLLLWKKKSQLDLGVLRTNITPRPFGLERYFKQLLKDEKTSFTKLYGAS